MSPVGIASIAFACAFGGLLLGMFINSRLPERHLSRPTQDTIKLGMGMIATVTGLVLGLLVASAKSSFDTADSEIKQVAAKLVLLDHIMVQYGPETEATRSLLRQYVSQKLDELWPEEAVQPRAHQTGSSTAPLLETLQGQVDALTPRNDNQRQQRSRALAIANDLAQTRWLMIEQTTGSAIPNAFLAIVIFWLTILFMSFGLFAPRNATVILAMLVCALSVATALFLVLEMDRPLEGFIKISSAPARKALANMR